VSVELDEWLRVGQAPTSDRSQRMIACPGGLLETDYAEGAAVVLPPGGLGRIDLDLSSRPNLGRWRNACGRSLWGTRRPLTTTSLVA
jgi:hypothetical protein